MEAVTTGNVQTKTDKKTETSKARPGAWYRAERNQMTKLEQHERGLDQAYNQLLESREALQLVREQFEERMLEDKDFFADYAWKFMGTAEGYKKGLLDFSWELYQAENTPAHTDAWEERPSNAEYWNWNDDRV